MFLEPTCGNGQFLVKVFEKRIQSGIDILTALNTMVGMDISQENILECHSRLYERVVSEMRVQGYSHNTDTWNDLAVNAIAIIRNNIFKVKDSIAYISNNLEEKKFFSFDPTGNKQVLPIDKQMKKIEEIKNALHMTKAKNEVNTLSVFFAE